MRIIKVFQLSVSVVDIAGKILVSQICHYIVARIIAIKIYCTWKNSSMLVLIYIMHIFAIGSEGKFSISYGFKKRKGVVANEAY